MNLAMYGPLFDFKMSFFNPQICKSTITYLATYFHQKSYNFCPKSLFLCLLLSHKNPIFPYSATDNENPIFPYLTSANGLFNQQDIELAQYYTLQATAL